MEKVKKFIKEKCLIIVTILLFIIIGVSFFAFFLWKNNIKLEHLINNKTEFVEIKNEITDVKNKLEEIEKVKNNLQKEVLEEAQNNEKKLQELSVYQNFDYKNKVQVLKYLAIKNEKEIELLQTILNEDEMQKIISIRKYKAAKQEDGLFDWPVKGIISSNYGYRNAPFNNGVEFHKGVDIAAEMMAPVIATKPGIISQSGNYGGYGNFVEIKIGDNDFLRYGHNAVLLVSEGQEIEKGEVIALVGSTGYSTGPHLHYEIIINGQTVDPLLFLNKKYE